MSAGHETSEGRRRLYGNWRPERGWGVGSLTTTGTVAVFVAVLVPLLSISTVPVAAPALTALAVIVIAATVVRIGGVSAVDVATRRIRFARASRGGWTDYSGGVLADPGRAGDLPGVLAPLQVLDVDDGRGGRQGLLWNRRTGTLTALLRCAPAGLDLADPEQTDTWVAGWGGFLADLGYQPLVRHVAVCVDTAPTGGTSTAEHVATHLDPAAPLLARTVLGELAATAPAVSASVSVHVAVCLDPDRATPRPKDLLAAVVEAGRRLPALETGLTAAGVALLGRGTPGWVAGRFRTAFDPPAASDLRRHGIGWDDAGPVGAVEGWDRYRHDGAVSVSWALREAPRQAVGPSVLAPLLAPGPFARRLAWLYEPYPAELAATRVEAQVTAGQIRRAWAARTRRDETQRERDDRDRALQSAREEAEGAGVGRFTAYVTTTVTDEAFLDAAAADLEQRAGQAKLRLRRLWGAQAAGFAAALGVGVDPATLTHPGSTR